MFRFALLFLSSSLIFVSVHADSCRFQTTKGVIDLTTVGRTDGVPAFSDVSPGVASNYKYSYNPCKPFTEGSECFNVAACQVSNDLKYRFAIGSQESAQWNEGAGLGSSPSITYTSGEKTTVVTLACEGDTVQLEALGENPTNTYKFRLTHKCACWDGCGGSPGTSTTRPGPPGGDGSGKTSGGLIFIIILIVVVVLYVVGFSTLNYFQYQRRGAEVLPHRLFWVALVGYARDGTVFIYRRVTGKGDTNYSSV